MTRCGRRNVQLFSPSFQSEVRRGKSKDDGCGKQTLRNTSSEESSSLKMNASFPNWMEVSSGRSIPQQKPVKSLSNTARMQYSNAWLPKSRDFNLGMSIHNVT